mmetsp:Transcript_29144/g.55036  ORF Transcript_29144/g.55036 Transcript_29144/m.55036 type:complete len:492 (-) Transcript_29144:111-1586(-)|eukprot:CAMPEP_0182505082 /NCGR_PEP_ID=MMETSP1321-20130603/18404_1 /TAXON_ID=91990 /ORGANISM="Bolidomonas sp., Strain RCC1657" /LENGTH=491 /DNA_ID=CAMNT_0024710547 /DNA_START=66 /DNA_END=1541 /DNA_ORIENTATION=-
MSTPAASPAFLAKWNLTSSCGSSMDPHLLLPLLEFADATLVPLGVFDAVSVSKARLSLLNSSNMVDYAIEIYDNVKKLSPESVTDEELKKLKKQRDDVMQKMNKLTEGAKPFTEILGDEKRRAKMEEECKWNVKGLKEQGVTEETLETYRQLAKFQYECGDYETSHFMIDEYLSLFVAPSSQGDQAFEDSRQQNPNKDGLPPAYGLTSLSPTVHAVLWGKLSSLILMARWDEAMVALNAVKYSIEYRSSVSGPAGLSALRALKERTWLLHWGLFVFWNNSKKGLDAIIDLYTNEKYMQAIQTNAPHLLRYLTAAVIVNKRKRLLNELVKIYQHCNYVDPIVQFVDCLYNKFDFEGAQNRLHDCENVLSTDFFLHNQTGLFMEEARIFIFENYCRIHQKIDISTLGEKLAMNPAEAERWIVDLIRNAFLDAKIDSTNNCVVMGHQTKNIYQQVIDKTKDLNVRSNNLTNTLRMVVQEAKADERKRRDQRGDD